MSNISGDKLIINQSISCPSNTNIMINLITKYGYQEKLSTASVRSGVRSRLT